MELVRQYVQRRSDDAFATLVSRHVNLVYSAALRKTGRASAAEEVTQSVFTLLARKADRLSDGVILSGWLYQTTRLTASGYLRTEIRRTRREQEAYMQWLSDEPEAKVWSEIEPLLEDAMGRLGDQDRNAIVQRFFEGKNFQELAAAFGTSENAAKKRVGHALEKLRKFFSRRGVSSTTAVIAAAISANSVHAAPVALAKSVTTAALVKVAAGAGTASFLSSLTKTLLMKKSTALALALVLAAGLLAPVTIAKVRQARANTPVTGKNLRQGLVLDLTFDHDEVGGDRVIDDSGLGNHGQASGVRWTAEGQRGGAYEFSADGQQIEIPNQKSLNPDRITLSAWIKTTSADAIWRRIFDKSYSKGFALSLAGDWQANQWRGLASVEMGPGEHFLLTKKKVDDGQWHQLVLTFDGADQLLYLDGQPQSKLHWNHPGQVGSTGFNLVIGCNRSNIGEVDLGTSFRGLIDEPMMWNRALSQKEVAFLFGLQNGSTALASAAK